MSIECELTWLPTLDPRPIAAQNMEPLHGLSPNPTPSSVSASQAASPTRYFVALWRNIDFPFSEPEKQAFPQRRCKISARPWARGNFHACYTMVNGHSREVDIYIVVQSCTVFFPSYGPVN